MTRDPRTEYIDLEMTIMHTTAAGVLVSDGDVEAWLPIAAVRNWEDDWGPGDMVTMEIWRFPRVWPPREA